MTSRIVYNSINGIISVFHVLARHKYQFRTFVECVSARQSYLRYIVLRNCR